jgi:hypothetical protein
MVPEASSALGDIPLLSNTMATPVTTSAPTSSHILVLPDCLNFIISLPVLPFPNSLLSKDFGRQV